MAEGKIQIVRNLYGCDICAEITLLKNDIHVLITGGSLPHTGAVSMYCNGKQEGAIQPEGHRDKVVADRWSQRLSEEFCCRVTAVCGIHYDKLATDEIRQVVFVTDEMLQEASEWIEKQR